MKEPINMSNSAKQFNLNTVFLAVLAMFGWLVRHDIESLEDKIEPRQEIDLKFKAIIDDNASRTAETFTELSDVRARIYSLERSLLTKDKVYNVTAPDPHEKH